jgi:hypothetical protein
MWCSGSYKHIYLRGRGFESLGAYFFNLILARCGVHVGMRIGFVGGRMRMALQCGRNGKDKQLGIGFAVRTEWE